MSKIYEALLQAEQDRKAAAEVVDQAPNHLATPAAPPDIAPTRFETQGPASDENSLTNSATGEFQTTIWKPQLISLPAAGEKGLAIEQFRNLRTRLFELRDNQPLKSILVSSGLAQEGKSYVAANLAISLGRDKASRVLLIDGDLRRSSLHRMLGCASHPGLANYLDGKAALRGIIQRPSRAQDGPPLPLGLGSMAFIAGGEGGGKTADLSGNGRFEELIAELAPSFDWIIVDSSPVNLVADAVNLSRACDGALLVVRSGITRFETAQRALAELKASRLLGVVLNAAETVPSSGNYYGYDSLNTTKR